MMEFYRQLTLVVLLKIVVTVVADEEGCYFDQTNPYFLFAGKTSYFQVDNEDESLLVAEGCQAKSFWFVARHGTRNPGDDDILLMAKRGPILQQAIVENHNANRGTLCKEDVEGIADWTFNLTAADDSQLTNSGRLEHYQLAQRISARLPDLLGYGYDRNFFQFRHTIKQRAEESAKSFAAGAFPGEDVYIPEPLEDDLLLRFFDFCPKWQQDVHDCQDTFEEQNLFAATEIMAATLQSVNSRLGFPEILTPYDIMDNNTLPLQAANESTDISVLQTLTFDDLLIMYDICRYEKAFQPQNVSYFCAAFNTTDLQVMEYYEDLEYFYKLSYGSPINEIMACPLIQDLVEKFDSPQLNGTFYFTHNEAMLPFITLLGLHRDGFNLSHMDYESNTNRQFRSSHFATFASNVGFVLFDCPEDNSTQLMTLVQERGPVKIPQCAAGNHEFLCDWQEFKAIFKDKIDCNFKQACQTVPHNGQQQLNSSSQYVIVVAILTLYSNC